MGREPAASHHRALPGALYYVEMVQPNDIAPLDSNGARLIGDCRIYESLVLRYGLFGHDFEKGVVFRTIRGLLGDYGTVRLACNRCTEDS